MKLTPEMEAEIARGVPIRTRSLSKAAAGGDSRDDLQQDVTLAVLCKAGRFDPSRSSWPSFQKLLIDHALADVLRRRRTNRERSRAATRPLIDVAVPDSRRREDRELWELAEDTAAAIGSLPSDLRAIAERLKSTSVAALARAMGNGRTRLYAELAEIRRHFEKADLGGYLDR